MSNVYHVPVMLKECIDALSIKPDGVYVDVTFGGGGHSREILKHLGPKGRLFAFDQDPDALENTIADERFTLIHQNFRFLKNNLRLNGVKEVDGILADLGVSSHQFDAADRGFSIRFDADLDMRMDQVSDLDAKKVLNTYAEEDLHRIFGMYGEIMNAKSLAKTVVTARLSAPIETVAGLKEVIRKLVPKGKEHKYHAQVFQALRIEVNKELEALQEFLLQTVSTLKPSGKLVVMSYHSLEDRLVKNFMAKGKFKGEVEKDFFGNEIKPFQVITRKAITASEEELSTNNRSRSAKLRVAEKMGL
ncbi:16S rRNA (cytosine(1402)-N(4))-methyltransferase RsmH [Sphingobacterium spiritivorum]|uniref:Ribosomal RNA small subunit methyltransferase H n=1 Tax=Sphingobacterium spiritivorum ATCC 33861 TaxID=525373 RepID=D7VTY5_SPHSI|nr:16S rRNA (cytosine(1402)-N(4))-methyltransferase RsmH [Sphingobacterium spiritivorum]EFK55764.1 S-adenosyl-methyltransferase MraW [Sphingobacterium spiritivorum ATCC 33861]QQT34108.1 16S rRNA (cytosine(1402)-N(4))-methyltransferase RsmH [Sphingobacterium spiritivorum]WQD34942.1 16S rRNA (cytosine(1402)-N(4))-methyltransferase RsmH [Sphingobacterium spiritivorum]SUI98686.1 Ribosomal RNA small subunit methyltransferase H [Sphingobacterium spiritivorum]